jgi:hypothetical protein
MQVDNDEDTFEGFTEYRHPRPGSVVALVEEQLDE